MTVRISKKARNDLCEIKMWIQAEDPGTADKVLERLLSGIEMLGEHPALAPLARDPRSAAKGVRALVREGFVVFYRPSGTGLRVMRVLRATRHWRHLR